LIYLYLYKFWADISSLYPYTPKSTAKAILEFHYSGKIRPSRPCTGRSASLCVKRKAFFFFYADNIEKHFPKWVKLPEVLSRLTAHF